MHYADATTVVKQLGQGAMLAKVDLHCVYTVNVDDHSMLRVKWSKHRYSALLWTEISTEDFLCICRCIGIYGYYGQ